MARRDVDAAPARLQVPVASTAPDPDGLPPVLADDGTGKGWGSRCRCLHGGCAFGKRRLGFGRGAEDVGCGKLQGRLRKLLGSCAMTASGGVGRSFHARLGAAPPFMQTPPYLGFTFLPKMVSTLHQKRGSTGGRSIL